MALNCQSYNCIHNDKDGKCFAINIEVMGRNAGSSSGTNCGSFVPENGSDHYEIAKEFINENKSPSNTTNINCAARNCMYNDNTACTASHVLIEDLDASCETFRLLN